MRKNNRLLTVLLILAALLMTSSLGVMAQDDDFQFVLADRIQAKVDAGEQLVIRVSYHDVSNEFAPFIRAGVERAAEELGVDARMIGPVGANADVQVSEIETLLGSVDGLAVSSVSTDALAPVIDRALEMGIPVVTFNTDNPDSNRLAFAGQDLVESGRAAGHLMAEQLGGEGNVIITTLDAAAQWSIDRETGAREALAEYPGITVLTTVNTGTEPQQIYANIENAMLANPNVDGILSLECCSNPAAGEYVLRNGLVGQVAVVGFDLLPQTLELIQEGAILATIDQAPEVQGFEAVNMLVQFLSGEELVDVDTGVGIYTIENIDDAFAEEVEEGVSLEDFALADRIQAKLDAGEELVIRVSYHDVSNEFAPFIRAGVERAAEELGVDTRMIGPVGANADAQVSEIETLLASIDGLAVSSVSTDALAPVIDRALEMGIPVVTFNTDNPDSNRLAFAGQDLVESGRAAGHLMAEQLGGEGNVIITTLDAAAQWSIDRETGAREALAEYPGITVLTTVNTGTEPQQIYANIENAMLANPNVDGILSLECCSNPAAGEYVLRNGLVGQVAVVGFDLLPQTLELIQEGAILATIDQAPEVQGFEAVNMLVQFLSGQRITDVDTGVGVYTIENLDEVLQD